MPARHLKFQLFWHRLMAAVAFVLTASLNIAATPESEGTRVAKEQTGQLVAAVKIQRDLSEPQPVRLDSAGDDGAGNLATLAVLASHPASSMARQAFKPSEIFIRPAQRAIRAGASRAPPTI